MLRGTLLFPLSVEPKAAFTRLILSPNTSTVPFYFSCLAGKTLGKNVGTPSPAQILSTAEKKRRDALVEQVRQNGW
jgi:hypothetical protein